ncbi:TonB-dependent receptor [Euzebyella saccharophila]|uniref:TonB-dependent receptor n=1 Tax=Euzebyella saccharophila TaxID=679664 RepID=A0ABV8JQQ1_9FLAO|nr:Plug domain-containing protein [Euzebyella saccharophila]
MKETPSDSDLKAEKNIKEDYSSKKSGLVQSSLWEAVDRDRLIELKEVVIADKKEKKRKTAPSVYGITPSRVRYQDFERPQTIPQLFLGIPGVQVIGITTFEPQIVLPKAAGSGPILWVLDGMPLVQPTNLADIMSLVSYIDIDKIEILYASQASIYGSRASGGAIVVYTRSGSLLDSYNRKDANIKVQGYHDSLNFDNYLDDLKKKSRKSENNLRTLYWNPNLRTNKKGEVLVEFESPNEKVSSLKLEAIAVTEKGNFGNLKVIH